MAATNSAINTGGLLLPPAAFASRPSASIAGRLFPANDAPVGMWLDNGSTWQPLIGQAAGIQPPAIANWTALNASGGFPQLTDLTGALHYVGTNEGATTNYRGAEISLSSSTAYVEACVLMSGGYQAGGGGAFPTAGIHMRESGTNKLVSLWVVLQNTNSYGDWNLETWNWTSLTVRGTGVIRQLPGQRGMFFLRLRRSGSNLLAETSFDRTNYTQIDSRVNSGVFATAPDMIGFGAMSYNAASVFDVLSLAYGS